MERDIYKGVSTGANHTAARIHWRFFKTSLLSALALSLCLIAWFFNIGNLRSEPESFKSSLLIAPAIRDGNVRAIDEGSVAPLKEERQGAKEPVRSNAFEVEVPLVILPSPESKAIITAANANGEWDRFLDGVARGVVRTDYQNFIDINGPPYPTLMSMVIGNAPPEVVSKLIHLGVPLHANHFRGAVASGSIAKVKMLLSQGIHPSAMTDGGVILMHYAMNNPSVELLNLLDQNIPGWVDTEKARGTSLFDIYLGVGHDPDVLRFLLEKGIYPTKDSLHSKNTKDIPESVLRVMKGYGVSLYH